jgi:hypothetical protein
VATVLLPEDFHRRFALGDGADDVGFHGMAIGRKVSPPNWLGAADAGVHDDAVQAAQFVFKTAKYLEDLFVVAHIQPPHQNPDVGIGLLQFPL